MATVTGRIRRRPGEYNELSISLNNKYDRAAVKDLQAHNRISNPLPTSSSRSALLPWQNLVNQRANEIGGMEKKGEITVAADGTVTVIKERR